MGKRKIAIQNPDTGEISYLMTGDGSVLYAKNSGLKILTDINMSGNAVDNIVISEVDGLPTTGKEGQITYYDGSFYCCNGKIWSKMSIVGEETIDEGEIFNDYDNNRAISKYSVSHGSNNLAGAKAFKITAFGTTDSKTYTLDSVEGLEVGDVFSVHLKNEYDNYGKIVSINPSTKVVAVDNFKEAETATEGNPVLNIFRIAAKPEVGTTDFAEAAFAEGSRTKAVAKYAHAEGVDTTVIGNNGHAEGRETVAVYAAHAEGNKTIAYGDASHTEGFSTKAKEKYAHAEGDSTLAAGEASHAEGSNTDTSASYAHSEGLSTSAAGEASHVEGFTSVVFGYAAHAEGSGTVAMGDGSHTEGDSTVANGLASHAEGHDTQAFSNYSSAHGITTFAGAKCFNIKTFGTTSTKTYTLDSVEGLEVGDIFSLHLKNEYDNQGKITEINTSTKTVTVDNFKEAETATEGNPVLNIFRIAAKPEVGTTDFAEAAFAEGSGTKAVAKYAHAEGVDTTVIGNNGHAEGRETLAVYAAHAEGERTKAYGDASHTEGANTTAQGGASHAEGGYTKAMGHYSHTEGYNTIANNDYQHVQGKYNIEDTNNKYAHIIGNGSSNKRSNAHTIDWNGNAWFAGKVMTGNTQEELATKSYVDSVAGDISNTYYIDINEGISSDEWAEIMTIPNFSPSKTYIVNNRTYGGNQAWEILILNEEHNMRDEDDTALAIKHTTLKLTSEGKLLAKAGEYWGTVPKTVGLTMRLIIVDSSHVITSLA